MTATLNDIKYFKIVAETHNLTRAAERIGLSQSALSYAIKRLENSLDIELFIRMKNGLALTKSGEILFKQSNNLINEWDTIKQLVYIDTLDKKDITGEYSFGIHQSVALYTVDKFLPKISKTFPKLRFNFIHGLSREMTEKVINWKLDFAIAINPVKHNDLVIIKLGEDKVTLFSTDSVHNSLIFDPNLLQTKSILSKINKNKYKNYRPITSTSLELIGSLAAHNMGVGVLPNRVACKFPNLSPVPDAPYYIDKLCLIYRYEKHQNNISQEIINIIKESVN
jgi:DNA-binding transcriptional LysR family regulator